MSVVLLLRTTTTIFGRRRATVITTTKTEATTMTNTRWIQQLRPQARTLPSSPKNLPPSTSTSSSPLGYRRCCYHKTTTTTTATATRAPLPTAPRILPGTAWRAQGQQSPPRTSPTSKQTKSPKRQQQQQIRKKFTKQFDDYVYDYRWYILGVTLPSAWFALGYYGEQQELYAERMLGKLVQDSELDGSGWSPGLNGPGGPLGKRKWVPTKWGWFPEEDAGLAPGKMHLGGQWSLVDMDGNFVTNKSFEGKWYLMYFGFTRCPEICPTEMSKMGRVRDAMLERYPGLADKLALIFVTIDPQRDSLQALENYAADFHPDFIFLTGSPLQIRDIISKYKVYVSVTDEEEEDGDYLVDHSIFMYLHNEKGEVEEGYHNSMLDERVVEKVVYRMTFVQPIVRNI